MGPWLKTAPIARSEASVVTTKGLLKSGYWSKGSQQILSRKISKLCCCSTRQLKSISFFSRAVSGLAIFAKSGINRR